MVDLATRARDEVLDRLKLDRVHHGTDVDALVQWIAHAQLVHARFEAGVERTRYALLHQEARARAADLPLIEPDRVDQPFDSAVEIGILKDDVG